MSSRPSKYLRINWQSCSNDQVCPCSPPLRPLLIRHCPDHNLHPGPQESASLPNLPSTLRYVSDIPFLLSAKRGFTPCTSATQSFASAPTASPTAHQPQSKTSTATGQHTVKDRFYSEACGSHAHLADVVGKQDHARKRKVLTSAYVIKNLEGWEIRVFDGKCTTPLPPAVQTPQEKDLTLDFRSWTSHFTAAVMASIGLSEDLAILEQGSDIISSESMDGKVKKASFREYHEASGTVTYRLTLPYEWFPVFKRLRKAAFSYPSGEKPDDSFIALMKDKKGAPHNLEMGEIVPGINITMNAGSDNIAIAAEECLVLPAEESAVHGEVVAPYSKVKHLPYLRACLDESLRMLPPVTFGLPRRTPPGGTTILGDYVWRGIRR
ncbi:hypothetical protein BDW75DRAFT_236258 [Aspergillus navahoensis]